MSNKKAKFFCENCGAEVPENARVCKNCGKFFISVRCPRCGATGPHSDFENGCPKCGYAVPSASKKNISFYAKEETKTENVLFFKRKKSENRKNETSLPAWIYIFTITVFIGVIFLVYSCIKNPY